MDRLVFIKSFLCYVFLSGVPVYAQTLGQPISPIEAVKMLANTKTLDFSKPLSPDEAVRTITITKPFFFNLWVKSREWPSPPKFVDQLTPLYNRQLQAIKLIGDARFKNQTANLIPYLNYVSNSIFCAVAPRGNSTGYISQAWPTYGAILNLPDAVPTLKEYALNEQNPLNYRLATFVILRDMDKNTYTDIRHDFDTDLEDASPAAKECLKEIEDGSGYFWGVPDIKVVH